MNLEQVRANRSHITDLAESIFKEKNKEYASDQDRDALGNFHKAAAEYGIHPQLVLGIFMDKHLACLRAHIAARAAGIVPKSSEPLQSRIADAINYLHFLYALEQEAVSNFNQKIERFKEAAYADSRPLQSNEQVVDGVVLSTLHNLGADDV